MKPPVVSHGTLLKSVPRDKCCTARSTGGSAEFVGKERFTAIHRDRLSDSIVAAASHQSFFRRRKPKDEERLFLCERRLRNPHAPRFSAPKIFRGYVAQYLPSRAYRLVTGSFEVREFHSYVVDVGAMIFNVDIVSRHDSASI